MRITAERATEFSYRCTDCGADEAWTTEAAMEAAAVWHIFMRHRDIWTKCLGDRLPPLRRPAELGRKFEDWERQSP